MKSVSFLISSCSFSFSVRVLLTGILFLSGTNYVPAQTTLKPFASYYFSGSARDTVGGIHGVVHGASPATDRFGNANAAFCFDGENDYITLGTNSDLKQGEMSISLWVKINSYTSLSRNYPGMSVIQTRVRNEVEYYEAYSIAMLYKNHKFVGANVSSAQQLIAVMSKSPAEIDKWNHLTYMFSHDSTYLYLNGKLEQKNYKGFISSYLASDSVVIGYVGNHMPDTFKYTNYAWLNGCVDDVKFFNRVLSHEEVGLLFNEQDPKFEGSAFSTSKIKLVDLAIAFWYIPFSMMLLAALIIFIIRRRLRILSQRQQARNEIERQLAQMEMKALRGQMNPHFIFNALNSIQHYVLTNEKALANKYLVKFSQLVRNILELSSQELVNLEQELDTIKLYLDIESLRFNSAFSYAINVDPQISLQMVQIPPLIIQPFVENAIWHGLLLKNGTKVLSINIYRKERTTVIEIDDNGIGREAAYSYGGEELKRKSFGLKLTQDRLELLEKVYGIHMSFVITDKKDAADAPEGTMVKLIIATEQTE